MGCKASRSPKKKFCLGDFRHSISVIDSEINPSTKSYDIDNSDIVLTTKAKVKTKSGIAFFNGVSVDSEISHDFTIRFPNLISIQKNFRILFNGDLYRIEKITNIDEDSKYLIIGAVKRGKAIIKANNR